MQIARVGDIATGICRSHDHPISVTGVITNGSSVVKVEGLPASRLGDIVSFSCGHSGVIASGSSVTFCDGKGLARVGDIVVGPMTATIVIGSSKTTTI